jgi:hypothetical protein
MTLNPFVRTLRDLSDWAHGQFTLAEEAGFAIAYDHLLDEIDRLHSIVLAAKEGS